MNIHLSMRNTLIWIRKVIFLNNYLFWAQKKSMKCLNIVFVQELQNNLTNKEYKFVTQTDPKCKYFISEGDISG